MVFVTPKPEDVKPKRKNHWIMVQNKEVSSAHFREGKGVAVTNHR